MNRSKCSIVIVAVLIVAAVFTLYDLNGNSFDLSDRHILLIVTDSMDGDNDSYAIHSFPKDTFVMVEELSQEQIPSEIAVGDVIAFDQGGFQNHHRVISIHLEDGYVQTKGDNAPLPEDVPLQSIKGKVVGTNHILGVVVSFLLHHTFIVLATMFTITAVDYILWVLRDEKKKQTAGGSKP